MLIDILTRTFLIFIGVICVALYGGWIGFIFGVRYQAKQQAKDEEEGVV